MKIDCDYLNRCFIKKIYCKGCKHNKNKKGEKNGN